jgi:hypothetical protein
VLIVLSLALMMGILALRPGIQISGTSLGGALRDFLKSFRRAKTLPVQPPGFWLDAAAALELAETVEEEEALRELCRSVAENQVKANHATVMRDRRLLMYRQLTLVLIGLVLLLVALTGFQLLGGPP